MKNKIVTFILWDAFIYLMLYIYDVISNNLRNLAAKEFNNDYNFILILLTTILFVILGFTFNIITNQKKTEVYTVKNRVSEFVIIGLNALFLSTLFIWTWVGINNFLPDWLISNTILTSSLGGAIFGLELYRVLKKYES